MSILSITGTAMPETAARLMASFARRPARTVMTERFCSSPLKIAKTFELERAQTAVYMMDCSPGMMEGDRYELSFRLEAGSRVYLTNQSYTKVHPAKYREARHSLSVDLEPGALLEYFPEPLMLYRDARYKGEARFALRRGSTLMTADIVCPGRTRCGESFRFAAYDSRVVVEAEGEPVYYSRQLLNPGRQSVRPIGILGEYTHWGTFILAADDIPAALPDEVRQCLDEDGTIYGGATLADRRALVVSAVAVGAWELAAAFERLRGVCRERLLGLPPLRVRK